MKLSSVIIVLAAGLFIGCGQKSSGVKASSTEGRGLRGKAETVDNRAVINEPAVSSSEWGRVFMNPNDLQTDFQSKVEDFLSPQLNQNQIGTVSGNALDTTTGIAFYGRGIKFKNQSHESFTSFPLEENVFDETSSELRIVVYDSLAQTDEDSNTQNVLREIPIHFNSTTREGSGGLVYSYVGQNYIQLVFEDYYGRVSLNGQITPVNGKVVYFGEFIYRNLRDKNGNSLSLSNENQKQLGLFEVSVCDFFDVAKILDITCN